MAKHERWPNHHEPPAGIGARISDTALRGFAAEPGLLSYLYFIAATPEHLIELGRADAEAHADELVAFFSDGA